ncbi:Protein argonaute 16 [Camellia lanceoleosa]|uniref:Protein argonaute 16 n=1 Tax=Camellia lanceoleosa TaxID=1840588 RepID=A0ACC0FYT7_9ERIC|nr:Protein argonaute 16 [Camellia lanceoleosa]
MIILPNTITLNLLIPHSCHALMLETKTAQLSSARALYPSPKLKVGNGEDCMPRNGQWNFNNKQLFTPIRIERWEVVNFSARCDTSHLSRELTTVEGARALTIMIHPISVSSMQILVRSHEWEVESDDESEEESECMH